MASDVNISSEYGGLHVKDRECRIQEKNMRY